MKSNHNQMKGEMKDEIKSMKKLKKIKRNEKWIET